jgi:NADPH-dependent curcumin reductase CurA
MTKNRQWLIAGRPNGRALQESDFEWVTRDAAPLKEGEVRVRVMHLSCDPAQKGWMENIGGYTAPTNIGDVMRASGVGEVVESKSTAFKSGDKVLGQLGWQDLAVVAARDLESVADDDLLSANLGAIGTTGLTALFGLSKLGKPFAGDTMVITGAAGATGSVVGQIGKISGCRVVGIAGGADKCQWLVDELGFDSAIDYKAGDVRSQLKKHAPQGIDVVWDNVGGKLLNDMLGEIALHARVVVCGGISRYETGQMPAGPQNYFNLIFKRATMHGLLLTEYTNEFEWGRKRLREWVRSGELKFKEDVQEGLENAPRTLMRLFSGANFGKQLIKI